MSDLMGQVTTGYDFATTLINSVLPEPAYRYGLILCDQRGLKELIYLMGALLPCIDHA